MFPAAEQMAKNAMGVVTFDMVGIIPIMAVTMGMASDRDHNHLLTFLDDRHSHHGNIVRGCKRGSTEHQRQTGDSTKDLVHRLPFFWFEFPKVRI